MLQGKCIIMIFIVPDCLSTIQEEFHPMVSYEMLLVTLNIPMGVQIYPLYI